ncbi:MAG: MFS transporter [Gammaproteobacteria bacterium]|nr:MAG: MFS transporter [Gammaproteobacteria bacterium]
MSRRELQAATSLASIYFMRMLGLFMILPVFALYAEHLPDSTPLKVGLALGAYGLTQALLQIPFGLLSDRIGRKPVIVGGLLLFGGGSVLAAVANSVTVIIIGRALQGAGAIAAAVMAMAADLTSEQHRTKAMAIIGVSIGFAFLCAFLLGPVLNAHIGVPGLFWLAAGMALAAIAILLLWVPTPTRQVAGEEADAAHLGQVLRNPVLLRLDLGIALLHLILTACFVVIPLLLRDQAGLAPADHWKLYLPVMLGSVVLMAPAVMIAERRGLLGPFFTASVALLAASLLGMGLFHGGALGLGLLMLAFFTAINFLESCLPSLVSRLAPGHSRGAAMGAYSTAQFLGSFLGGALGGWLHGALGEHATLIGTAVLATSWIFLSLGMPAPARKEGEPAPTSPGG